MNHEYPLYTVIVRNRHGFKPEEGCASSVRQCKKWALTRYHKDSGAKIEVYKRITLSNDMYEYVQCRKNKEI